MSRDTHTIADYIMLQFALSLTFDDHSTDVMRAHSQCYDPTSIAIIPIIFDLGLVADFQCSTSVYATLANIVIRHRCMAADRPMAATSWRTLLQISGSHDLLR